MASDETPTDSNEPKKKPAPRPRPRPAPQQPPRHTQAAAPQEGATTATAVEDDDEVGRLDAIKEAASRIPKWGWAVIVVVVLVVVAFFVVPSKDKSEGGGNGDENFTITYRQQLTQDGVQAGCFVLMEGTRAIGISCIPAK